jgi:hypothetical protein
MRGGTDTHKQDCKCRPCEAGRGRAKKKDVGWTIDAEVLEQLKREASRTGEKQIEIVEKAIRRYIEMERAELEKKWGSVTHNGKKYILREQAECTSRLLPDHLEGYFEMSARGYDAQGEDVVVYWMFENVTDEDGDPAELDSYDYDDIDRIEER